MNRRKFLATLFGAGAALAVGPTLLALVPKPAPLPHPIFWSTELAMPVGLDEQLLLDRYIAPAVKALQERIDAHLVAALCHPGAADFRVRLTSEAA